MHKARTAGHEIAPGLVALLEISTFSGWWHFDFSITPNPSENPK